MMRPRPVWPARRSKRGVGRLGYAIWFRWFIEGLCNPLRYVDDETKTIVDVVADTVARIDVLYAQSPKLQ